MFKKLVSHLKFSPSLIGELADLSNRLRVQNPVRIISVLSLGTLLTLQVILYLNPPVGSNSTYAGNIFFDSSIEINDVVNQLSTNYKDTGDIFTAVGITKDRVQQSTLEQKPSLVPEMHELSRWPINHASIEQKYNTSSSIYLTPTHNLGQITGNDGPFIKGTTIDQNPFLISSANGSVYIVPDKAQLQIPSPITLSVDYINTSTQSTKVEPLKPGDRIKITLTGTNSSSESQEHSFKLPLGDSLEYLDIDNRSSSSLNASLDKIDKSITWDPVEIISKTSASREVTLRVKSSIPNNPQNPSSQQSQDCIATFIHGNQLDLPIACTYQKELELITSTFPSVSQGTLLLGNSIALILSIALLVKSLQEEEEIRLIRHKFNSGT